MPPWTLLKKAQLRSRDRQSLMPKCTPARMKKPLRAATVALRPGARERTQSSAFKRQLLTLPLSLLRRDGDGALALSVAQAFSLWALRAKPTGDRRLCPKARTHPESRHRSPSPRGLERPCPQINHSCFQSNRPETPAQTQSRAQVLSELPQEAEQAIVSEPRPSGSALKGRYSVKTPDISPRLRTCGSTTAVSRATALTLRHRPQHGRKVHNEQ